MKKLTSILLVVFSSIVFSQEVSPVQATARPLGIDIVGPVNLEGSDQKAQKFNTYLPSLQRFVQQNLSEQVKVTDVNSIALDPEQLYLHTASQARVYYISEGAGFHNTLGFNTSGLGTETEDARLIFPDASQGGRRRGNTPLQPGDFVDLGQIEAQQQLNFFLLADGARGGRNEFSTTQSRNPDGLVHAVTFALPDSPYLIIGFEDLYGGGDEDYNDLVFALEIGVENVQALVGAPEPQVIFLLLLFSLMLIYMHKKQKSINEGFQMSF